MKFYVTGDNHRDLSRFKYTELPKDYSIGIIILGDAGVNYLLDSRDEKFKEKMNRYGFIFFLLRGNHEARPEDIPGMAKVYDPDVKGYIYIEQRFENLRYLIDGETYQFGPYSALAIGGAYSVDKYYRLSQGWTWFENEQLTAEEREKIFENIKGKEFDFVLTHTCPKSLVPTELFISGVQQKEVDNTMEFWLDDIKENITYTCWLFGHFHADKPIKPGSVYLLYNAMRPLEEFYDFCVKYPEGIFKHI